MLIIAWEMLLLKFAHIYIYNILYQLIFSIDEIKWQLRFPTRYAMRDMKRSYLPKIQEEIQKFLDQRIKHNFITPEKGLNLDLTIKEGELLISANQSVRDLAETGEL